MKSSQAVSANSAKNTAVRVARDCCCKRLRAFDMFIGLASATCPTAAPTELEIKFITITRQFSRPVETLQLAGKQCIFGKFGAKLGQHRSCMLRFFVTEIRNRQQDFRERRKIVTMLGSDLNLANSLALVPSESGRAEDPTNRHRVAADQVLAHPGRDVRVVAVRANREESLGVVSGLPRIVEGSQGLLLYQGQAFSLQTGCESRRE